jgi:hypothetical protein
MRTRLITSLSLVTLVAWVAVLTPGCSRQAGPDTMALQEEAASKLPGATNIFAALKNKDYEGALTALAKVKEALTTDQQQIEYAVLTSQVKTRLMEAAATDPKATEALNVLRSFSTGR